MARHRQMLVLGLGVSLMMGALAQVSVAAEQNTAIELRAAGSLKAAMTEIIRQYQAETQQAVVAQYSSSGILRERIEAGEKVDIFASANMQHPQALVDEQRGTEVVMFARNQLCALAQPNLPLTTGNFLDVLLDPETKLGISTPKFDPAGDYALTVFEKAEALQPQAQSILTKKALKLTGSPNSAKAPIGRNLYAWVMENQRADVFLTYCTNAKLAQQEIPELQIVALPAELAIGGKFGLVVLKDANPHAAALANYILSDKAQAILADYGFQPPLR